MFLVGLEHQPTGEKPILRQRKLQQKSLFLHLTKRKSWRVCPSRLFSSGKPNLLVSPFSLSPNFGFLLGAHGGEQGHGGGHEAVLQRVLADERVESADVDLRRCVRWLCDHQRPAVLQGQWVSACFDMTKSRLCHDKGSGVLFSLSKA